MVAIKIIFLIIGFIVSINISGKNLNVYLESGSIISTSTSKLSSKKIINISKYGAIANDDIDDTKAIQNAINAEYGNDLYFNTGVYLISNLELISNTSLIGVESQKSTFKVIGPEGSKFISGKSFSMFFILIKL